MKIKKRIHTCGQCRYNNWSPEDWCRHPKAEILNLNASLPDLYVRNECPLWKRENRFYNEYNEDGGLRWIRKHQMKSTRRITGRI